MQQERESPVLWTSLSEILLGNVRVSTPLAARPVSLYQMDTSDDKKWHKLSHDNHKEFIAGTIVNTRALLEEVASSSEDDDSSSDEEQTEASRIPSSAAANTPEHMSSTRDPAPRHQPVPVPTSLQVTKEEVAQLSKQDILKSISACDDLVDLLKQSSIKGKTISTYRKLYLIDSGGQPQFHEILPAFLRRMTLYVFVFKLSEELATKPTVEYYDDSGHPVGTPYQSAHTNEQLLKHCIRTLHTHRASSESGDKASKIMVVGTHRDREAECKESREEKNRKIAKILLPTFKDAVVYFDMLSGEFIFPVNAKDPQEQDKDIIKDIQKLVLNQVQS